MTSVTTLPSCLILSSTDKKEGVGSPVGEGGVQLRRRRCSLLCLWLSFMGPGVCCEESNEEKEI